MTNIKTAISVNKPLFDEVDALAQEMEVSRSEIFARAASEYVQHHKNIKIMEAINKAYGDVPDENEETLRKRMRRKQRKIVENQW
ncbi:MAG: ribbon-helix-helix domain-containing protein [Dehalococcoidia bacterium]|jgi:metal-responsive CopG/Arc/MetJ family transcriptional regulator